MSWGHTLDDGEAISRKAAEIVPILAVLEKQLVELDRLGAMVAAAHLDAAIQHLRLDCFGTLSKPH